METTKPLTSYEKAVDLLAALSNQELIDLNVAIKELYNYRARKNSISFAPGMKVQWNSKYGYVATGVIKKVMQKNVTIEADSDGTLWRVNASMLTRI